jgi:hypothetical protein
VRKSSSRKSTGSQQVHTVTCCASPLDGEGTGLGEVNETFIPASKGKGALRKATASSGPVPGVPGLVGGSVINSPNSGTGGWGQVDPQQTETASELGLIDEGPLTSWSQQRKDTEEALESLESRAKKRKSRGKLLASPSRQSGTVVPEWQSLRDGTRSEFKTGSRGDAEEMEVLSGVVSDDEYEELYDEAESDSMSGEDEQQAQPIIEPRPDFTTMYEVMLPLPSLCVPQPATCLQRITKLNLHV